MKIEIIHVKKLFNQLHGMYGNQLFDKFSTGQLNEEKLDKGMLSAQAVWLSGLREFSTEIIIRAVERCDQKHKTYVPSLPEFRELCRSCLPPKVFKDTGVKIGISDELRKKFRDDHRQILASLNSQSRNSLNDFGLGISALIQMVSKAVGDGGGDEVKILLELEGEFLKKSK